MRGFLSTAKKHGLNLECHVESHGGEQIVIATIRELRTSARLGLGCALSWPKEVFFVDLAVAGRRRGERVAILRPERNRDSLSL